MATHPLLLFPWRGRLFLPLEARLASLMIDIAWSRNAFWGLRLWVTTLELRHQVGRKSQPTEDHRESISVDSWVTELSGKCVFQPPCVAMTGHPHPPVQLSRLESKANQQLLESSGVADSASMAQRSQGTEVTGLEVIRTHPCCVYCTKCITSPWEHTSSRPFNPDGQGMLSLELRRPCPVTAREQMWQSRRWLCLPCSPLPASARPSDHRRPASLSRKRSCGQLDQPGLVGGRV